MNKCILFCRVSTTKQSFDEQEKELYELAISDGYCDDNIIPICYKESGIKLSEEERAGLIEMKQLINTNSDINCVYSWEISRIARKKKILFSILDFLIEKKIQLIIKEPFIKLLNEDKTINEASETMFTLFAQIAESEMRNRKVRFARGMKEAKQLGKIHGMPKFGYKKNKDGYAELNDSEAELIRNIYNLYLSSELSVSKLHAELLSRGIRVGLYKLRDILNNKVYKGNKFYPSIITEEMWLSSVRKTKNNNKRAVKSTKRINLGEKLIRCPKCGKYFIAGNTSYKCSSHSANKFALTESEKCEFNRCMHIKKIDSLLWHIAKQEFAKYLAEDTESKINEINEQLEILMQKKDVIKEKQKKYDEVIERIAESYISGLISVEKRDARISKERSLFQQIGIEKAQLVTEIERLRNIQKELIDKDYLTKYDLAEASLSNITKREMWNIVHKFLLGVVVEEVELNRWIAGKRKFGKRMCIKITVYVPFNSGEIMYEENDEENWVIYYDGKYQRNPFFWINKEGVQLEYLIDDI